ncbi:MAG TPA: glycosyltransferase [Allocoleopsis sp.]
MTVSEFDSNNPRHRLLRRSFRLRGATLVMLGIMISAAAIAVAWFTGEGTINQLFTGLQALQEKPPLWLEVPRVTHQNYLLLPTISLLVGVLAVMKVSPQPRHWSRWLVVGVLLALMGRYVVWRSLTTLNLANPLNGVFSLWLFFLEMMMLLSSTIQLILMLNIKDRRQQASRLASDVADGRFTPSVDILIPTYNEPAFILRRTIVGCQAIDYANKTVYLLDDTKRPEIQRLAAELGCEYITRPNNHHAKAGNLNHALAQTTGELIVVFDADFIPTKNFLTRTVGFFQNEKIGLVQTPQSFYNPDPIAYNLGLQEVLTPEEEVFYRQIQPIRDGAGGVVCAGTSFVARRTALEKAGGFVTNTLSEDYFTGIRLAAIGYQLIYLDEKLSAGLAAENIAAHAAQRLRWAQGTLQAFFVEENPLTIPGLRPIQRLAHFEGLLHWFTSFSRVGFLIMPLAYSFLGVIPLQANAPELLYFFLPYYVMQVSVFSWLNYRSRSALLSDIYSLAFCFPLVVTVMQAMLRPFSKGFKVTPKGVTRDRFVFNWSLAWPLVILFIATAVSLWRNLGMAFIHSWSAGVSPTDAELFEGIGLGWIWSAYNLLLLGISLLILLDAPKPEPYEWFNLQRVVRIQLANQHEQRTPIEDDQSKIHLWGMTTKISEIGAQVALTNAVELPNSVLNAHIKQLPITLEIMEESLSLKGAIADVSNKGEGCTVRVTFDTPVLEQQRRLVEMLYCRPGQWQRRESPGELRSLLLLFKILLKPRVLFERKRSA